MNFASNASSTAVTQVARTLLGLLLAVLLARSLSEADRGMFAVVVTVALVAEQLSHLGMRIAVIYRVTRPGAARDRAVGAALQWTLFGFAVVIAAALAGSGWLRERFMLGAEPVVLYLALALAAADVFAQLADAVARGIDRFDLRNWDQISFAGVSLVAAFVALEILGQGLLGALVAIAVARLAVMAVFGALTLRASGLDLSADRTELRESLAVGVQGWFQTLLGKLHERADVVIMAALLLDPAQIAVYAVAVSVVDRLRVVPDSISVALLPQLASSSQAEAGPYTARVTRHVFFWVVLGSVLLALVAPALMPLIFGAPYAASVAPLLVLLPATVLLLLRTLPQNYFNATGNPAFIVRVQAVSLAVNVAANLWAIPRFGVIGAAWASVLSYGVEAVACLWAFRRRTRCGLRETLVLSADDLASYRSGVRRLLSTSGGEP